MGGVKPPISSAQTPIRPLSRIHQSAQQARQVVPGVFFCLVAAAAAYAVNLFVPVVSPLLVAIILGIAVTNVTSMPVVLVPGINFSAKKLLRLGIVLLGLRLALADILALGAPLLLVVVSVVGGGILGTIILGRILKVPSNLSLLVACGFSICGAAAVIGASGVVDPDDESEQDTVTAVALVVIFGTLMIPLFPLMAGALKLTPEVAGMWAGASIHEVAQVVAVGGIIGGGALTVSVVVKLARVLLLAPVVAVLSLRLRHLSNAVQGAEQPGRRAQHPPLVPLFIIGFLAMVLVRSFMTLPVAVLEVAQVLQTVLLSAAMFGLGCGVKVRELLKVGLRPFALAALATVLVSAIAYIGVMLVS